MTNSAGTPIPVEPSAGQYEQGRHHAIELLKAITCGDVDNDALSAAMTQTVAYVHGRLDSCSPIERRIADLRVAAVLTGLLNIARGISITAAGRGRESDEDLGSRMRDDLHYLLEALEAFREGH